MKNIVFSGILLFFMASVAYSQTPAAPLSKLDDDLVYTTTFGRADDIKILLEKGANPNTRNNEGWSVLAIAADRTDAEAVKIVGALLDGGASPNVFDAATKGYPIMNAVKNNQADIVLLLLSKGADYKVRDASGKALIDYAKARGNQTIIAAIQTKIDKEASDAASLRSPHRLRMLAERYAYTSCAFQYNTYYVDSRLDPSKDGETLQKIEQYKKTMQNTAVEIATYFPMVKKEFYESLSARPMQMIYTELEKMVSNATRRSKGVGSDEDMQRRCQEILKNVKISIPDKL